MIFLALSLLAVSLTPVTAKCDACIYGQCYEKIIVLERFDQIGQLDIDRADNIFYFHVQNSDRKSFSIAYDLDHVDMKRIADFSFGRTVDRNTRDVYLSLEDSVVKMNPSDSYNNTETLFNKTVWHLQFKDKLYYVEFGVNGLQTYDNGKHEKINALSSHQIDDFVVDKKGDIYFVSDFAVHRLKNGERHATRFADDIYVLSTDRNGEAHFAQPYQKAFYKVDYENDQDKMVEVGAINVGTPYKFVFTSDNFIIYNDIKLVGMYYLVPAVGSCTLMLTGEGKNLTKSVSVV